MPTWLGPLIVAIRNHDLNTVKRLIFEHGLTDLAEWPSDCKNFAACDLLYNAISRGDTEIVKELLRCGMPVNGASKCGFPTPLHMAVIIQNIEIVDMLLQRNADVFAKYESKNPLEYAVQRRNVRIAERLLNRVAHLNASADNNRMTQVYECQPIFSACFTESNELIELFLNRGSEIPMSSTKKTKLLILATQLHRMDLVELVMKHGADINAEACGTTALQTAVKGGNFLIVRCILNFCPDINGKGNMRILRLALEIQNTEAKDIIIDALIRYGFTVHPEDAIDGNLLKVGINQGHFEIVENLLKYGADVNASFECLQGATFLHVVANSRHCEIAKTLIEHGADVNMKHKDILVPPIYFAVGNLDLDMTKLFLSSGAVIEDMRELLSLAFQFNGIEIVKFLLKHDTEFDINAACGAEGTVLLNIIKSPIFWNQHFPSILSEDFKKEDLHKAEMAEFCLRRGADVNAKNIHGETAIFAAAERGLAKVVERLMKYGAEVDAKDDLRGNRTPLMIAVEINNLNVVQSLINFLPDSEIKDKHGRTALHLAVKYASASIVQELLNYGANINATSNDDTTPYNDFSYTPVKKLTLDQHLHKMIALDHHVSPKNIEFNLQEDFYNECKREIEKMKSTMISDSIITFHDFLTKGTEKLVSYVKNKNIANALNVMNDWMKKFPIYSAMMHCRFVKSIKLESLLTASEQSLDCLIDFELPYFLCIELLSYLSIKDLKNLIKASPATD